LGGIKVWKPHLAICLGALGMYTEARKMTVSGKGRKKEATTF